MKLFTAIVITLLMASISCSQSQLPLSCDDVLRIQVWRMRGRPWKWPPADGYCYAVIIFLTEEAGRKAVLLRDRTEQMIVDVEGHPVATKRIDLSTARGVVQSDAPHFDWFDEKQIVIIKKHEMDAFAAAHSICPEKTERKILTDGS